MTSPEPCFPRPLQAPRPGGEAFWYHLPKNQSFGDVYAFEEAMKGARTWAMVSLGLAGFALGSCHRPAGRKGEERRSVEPWSTGVVTYAPCQTDREAPDLVPDAICGDPRKPAPPAPGKPASSGAAVRGAGDDADGLMELDLKVKSLEQAVSAEPRNAHLWNDLAAAALVRAQRADDPRDLLRAFEAADRAVLEDPALPEARFNRALTLERLFLPVEARAAWQSYLELDRESDWADEAARRLTDLGQPSVERVWNDERQGLDRAALANDTRQVEDIAGRFRKAAREYAEQELLGEWAEAVAAGQTVRAEERLRIARSLGDALMQVSGERLVHDAVAVIDEASRGGDLERRRALVQGHRGFKEGYALYVDRKIEPAAVKLAQARAALTRAGSPFAVRAAFFRACCVYFEGQYEQAMAEMTRLAGTLAESGYPAVRAHALWMKGLLLAGEGQILAAADSYQQSRDIYRRMGEAENAAALEALLGENRQLVGYGEEGWKHLYRALRDAHGMLDPALASMVFWNAAEAALHDGFPRAALMLQEQVVRYAARCSPLRQLEALIWRARMEAHLDLREQALQDLQEARQRAGRLEDSRKLRDRNADAAMIEGSMIAREDPRRAISLLTSALKVYQDENSPSFILPTLLARARARRQAADEPGAEVDLRAGLETYERLGKDLSGPELWLAFLSVTGDVFDEMIALEAARDPELAFAYADRARTRVLPGSASRLWMEDAAEKDRLLAAEPQPLPLREIRLQLPADTTLVQFSVLPDRVLIWSLRRDGSHFFQQPVRREALEQSVARLSRSGRRQAEAARAASREIYDLLIRPWLPQVAKGERLVFVPDKVLHRVPFAALSDSASGRFLVEDHPIAVAPSATLYVNALARQRGFEKDFSRGLVVGDPNVDRKRFPLLPPLRAAAKEAAQLVKASGAVPLLGAAADKLAFETEAPRASWIHFAGHAMIDPRNMLLSKLMLAPGQNGDPGWLTAREIYSLKLDGTRLVVLAACDTGNEYVPGSEGSTSLARAFLAAGVPTVVATLRSVDDRATSRLFEAFHRHLLAGAGPVDALREAQLSMLRSGDEADRSLSAWGPFEVVGASAH
jgi:CHAT domain-containing protein